MAAATRTAELQDRLRALGFDPGPTDAVYGALTEEAIFDCMDTYCPPVEVPEGIVPKSWMPDCEMQRIICHWTAGAYTANSDDTHHYHILIEGDGRLVRGAYSIKDNADCSDGRYAAHTKNINTGSIGVSLCCMAGAVENPFDAGKYPMLEVQWETLSTVVAELCTTYGISVTPETVLSHAEVQETLDVAQSGKWDYTRLAFDPTFSGATACGDLLREEVSEKMANPTTVVAATAVAPSPVVMA